LSIGLIIEENFSMVDLEQILRSMAKAAEQAMVTIITGDTKVVPKGAADKIFINTSGIGLIAKGIDIGGQRAKVGDKIILSGTIADHGITILTQREGMFFESALKSDTAPLNHMVQKMLSVASDIHVLRDPTRGGVGTALNEIAMSSEVGVQIYEERIPVKNEVAGVCELLGFDPLYIANEGKLLAFVSSNDTDKVLSVMKENEYGKDACVIGEVVSENPKKVFMKTRIGGTRILDMLTGEQLPRIC
ncbi:MAG: hydrogenase expression/formation protein HypE, partial [Desulfobacterales bacterium]|nr:hydrogenase expression/formation protein HypE [Desulfobacterales bacterium]